MSGDGLAPVREVVIAGSGPAGYTAAIYAARAGLKPLVLLGSTDVGGALMTTTEVENYPGFSAGIEGPVLMEEMRAQAERFGAELVADEAVGFHLGSEVKEITDSSGTTHRARAVILAMGARYRRLGLDGENRLSGRGVSWCATCDGYPYRDRPVAVVGGGDAALEEALFLHRLGAQVQIIHRKDTFSASRILQDRVASAAIPVNWNSVVESINGTTSLATVSVRESPREKTTDLPLDGLFLAIGHEPRYQGVAGQVDLDPDGYVLTFDGGTATSAPGVFACGDLVDRRYRQAVTAAGSGCAAALDVERYLTSL